MPQMCWRSGRNVVLYAVHREQKLLPEQNVDLGMGLDRIVLVIQRKRSNYDTTMFTPRFDPTHKVQECSHTSGSWTVRLWIIEYRVVANHIHTLTVAITDGGKPGATGCGYVVCRILR